MSEMTLVMRQSMEPGLQDKHAVQVRQWRRHSHGQAVIHQLLTKPFETFFWTLAKASQPRLSESNGEAPQQKTCLAKPSAYQLCWDKSHESEATQQKQRCDWKCWKDRLIQKLSYLTSRIDCCFSIIEKYFSIYTPHPAWTNMICLYGNLAKQMDNWTLKFAIWSKYQSKHYQERKTWHHESLIINTHMKFDISNSNSDRCILFCQAALTVGLTVTGSWNQGKVPAEAPSPQGRPQHCLTQPLQIHCHCCWAPLHSLPPPAQRTALSRWCSVYLGLDTQTR